MGKELAESSLKSSEQQAMFCLAVPNRLLLQWRKETKNASEYIPLLNQSIVGEAVVIKPDCDSIGARYSCAHLLLLKQYLHKSYI